MTRSTKTIAAAPALPVAGQKPPNAEEATIQADTAPSVPAEVTDATVPDTLLTATQLAKYIPDKAGPSPRPGTKLANLITMLRSDTGATIAEVIAATGWQSNTVRGAMARSA